jgi:RNA:NAD 2'-phosphotransferase (TPT1/KptA family)
MIKVQHRLFSNVTVADILKEVENNEKQRFYAEWRDMNGQSCLFIRANQGHSLKVFFDSYKEMGQCGTYSNHRSISNSHFNSWHL